MNPTVYEKEWRRLKAGRCGGDELERLARRIANSFLDSYLTDSTYEKGYIDLLCEMTTFPEQDDPGTAAQALFGIIIERLCDEFEELQTLTYNRVMAQVISFCRKLAPGEALDRELKDFGIHSFEDLMGRMQQVRSKRAALSFRGDIEKVVLLSRVTIGADVAITSVIIQRLKEILPQAEVVVVGEGKLKEIFGPGAGVRLREVSYERKGGLLERLSTWVRTLDIVREEEKSCGGGSLILMDPDSRYSQLGVLPIAPLERYLFFDSRSQSAFNRKMSMAEFANDWLNGLFQAEGVCHPKVWPSARNVDVAAEFCGRFKRCGAGRIVVMNFGVGGNSRKRVGAPFEERLLLSLLGKEGTVVFLDKGAGGKEAADIDSLLDAAYARGYAVSHARLHSKPDEAFGHGAVGVETTIGEIAGLISAADEFIGYDSACQHIAAASGIPCVTVFAGSNNMRFLRRWRAFGKSSCRIVHVDTLSNPVSIDAEDIVARVMHARDFHLDDAVGV